METRANYLLVGVFVLLLAAGLAGFALWFAKVQFDTEFQRYDIRFAGTVTGLAAGGPVRFRGVRVGEVTAIRLDPDDPNLVLATIEIEAMTPVREDTRASLEIEGLTGARYVLLSGGSPDADPLAPAPGRKRAEIPSMQSSLEQVLEGAPELVAGANMVLARANALLSTENLEALSAILTNLNQLSGTLAAHGGDIGALIAQTGETMANLSRASAAIEGLLSQVHEDSRQLAAGAERALGAIEAMAVTVDGSVERTGDEIAGLIGDLRAAARGFTAITEEVEGLVAENREPLRDFTAGGLYELNTLLIEARALLTGLNRVTTEVERDPARFLFGDQQQGYEAGQ